MTGVQTCALPILLWPTAPFPFFWFLTKNVVCTQPANSAGRTSGPSHHLLKEEITECAWYKWKVELKSNTTQYCSANTPERVCVTDSHGLCCHCFLAVCLCVRVNLDHLSIN